MRLYWEVARAAARRAMAYRSAVFAGIFTNTVFGMIHAYVLLAVFRERRTVGGFDAVDAVTYTFVTQALIMVVGLFGSDLEQAQRIRTGEVALDLCRPYDYQAWWAAVAYGKAGFFVWARGLAAFAIGALLFDLRLPSEVWIWPAFAVSVVLAIGVSFAWGFLLQLTAFWILDVRGPNQIGWFTAQFLAGLLVPIVLFPDGLERWVRLLPFPAMLQMPVEVFLGKHAGADLAALYARQAVWLVVLLLVGRLVLARAYRRVVVHGG